MRNFIIGLSAVFLLNIFAFSTSASAACSDEGKVIIGKLKTLTSKNSNGRTVHRFYLLPKRQLCIVTDKSGRKSERYVRQLEIFPRNARIKDLKKFEDLRVAIRGTIYRKNRSRDAIAKKAEILGAYDPRNNRFHAWKSLKAKLSNRDRGPRQRDYEEDRYERRRDYAENSRPRREETRPRNDLESRRNQDYYEQKRRDDIEERLKRDERQAQLERDERRWENGPRGDRSTGSVRRYERDEDDEGYDKRDSSALTGLIKKSLRDYPADQEDYVTDRRRGSYTGNVLYGEILDFVTDDYLQFHQMNPADVVEFYTRYVDYNGETDLEREDVVREKFKGFKQGAQQRFKLYNRTLTVNKSDSQPDIYYVSFQFGTGRRSFDDTIWVRKQVKLTVDMGTDYVLIRNERVSTVGRNQY